MDSDDARFDKPASFLRILILIERLGPIGKCPGKKRPPLKEVQFDRSDQSVRDLPFHFDKPIRYHYFFRHFNTFSLIWRIGKRDRKWKDPFLGGWPRLIGKCHSILQQCQTGQADNGKIDPGLEQCLSKVKSRKRFGLTGFLLLFVCLFVYIGDPELNKKTKPISGPEAGFTKPSLLNEDLVS